MQSIKLPLFCACIILQIHSITSFANAENTNFYYNGYSQGNTRPYNYGTNDENANSHSYNTRSKSNQPWGSNNGGYWNIPATSTESSAYQHNSDPSIDTKSAQQSGLDQQQATNSYQPPRQNNGAHWNTQTSSTEHPPNQYNSGEQSSQQTTQANLENTNRSQQRHLCTISSENYDCQIQRVNLAHNDDYDFGLGQSNSQQSITFSDSTLQYLPKSLIDAFPNMRLLNLNDLKIERIQEGAFNSARNLETLYLEGNRLTTFPVGVLAGATKLQMLVLTNNEINSMPYAFKSNRLLRYIYVDHNKLRKLPTFEHLVQLKQFNASQNNLEEINNQQFVKQNEIEEIDLSHNRLKNLDVRLSTNNLNYLDVSSNELTNLSIPLIMQRLFVQNNSLSSFTATGDCYLKILDIHNNKLKDQPMLSPCNSLESLDLSNNLLEFFEFSPSFINLRYLNLAGNKLFDIRLPTKSNSPLALIVLDLSHNKLSYLPPLAPFKSLNKVDLNDNNLIAIKNYEMPASLKFLLVSNNEWKCDDVPKLARFAKDTKNTYCNPGFDNLNGICCKHYVKAFNDKLNEKVRDAYDHEQSNLDNLKKNCAHSTKSDNKDDIQQILRTVSVVDKNKADVLRKIEDVKKNITLLQEQSETEKNNRAQISNFKRTLALEIDKQRKNYRVTKEGLIDDKEMLNRIVKFVNERGAFTKDLLNRRAQETEETNQILSQKEREKQELLATIAQQVDSIAQLKKQEKDFKKRIEVLQKQVNRNAPSIHGKTGRS